VFCFLFLFHKLRWGLAVLRKAGQHSKRAAQQTMRQRRDEPRKAGEACGYEHVMGSEDDMHTSRQVRTSTLI